MNEEKQEFGFFKELARRKVFRSAGAYIVVAWVAIQVGSVILPEFNAPAWAMRALIIVFVAGFPPAMLLAWTLDISDQGVVRTPDSRYSRKRGYWPQLIMALSASAVAAGTLFWLWDDYIVQSPDRRTRPAIKSMPVVAVHPPRQLTGNTQFDWLGEGIANLIRSELTESRHLIVISNARWQSLTDGASSDDEIAARARSIGVDYLIDGELFETPNEIVLTTHIQDVESGVEISSPRASADDAAAIIARIRQLSVEIKQALNVPHQERVGMFEADFAIENIGAYEAYIAGLALLIDFEYEAAEDAFRTALDIAPDYHIARFRLAQLYQATGQTELARDMLYAIPTDANLSKRLQLYVDGERTYFEEDEDPARAIEIYRDLVELYPYEMEAGMLLAEAYWLDFQDAAAVAEFRRLAEIHPYDPTAWMALGERLLDIGDFDEAREALNRYVSMEPEDAFAYTLLGNMALLQGKLEDSISQHQRALELRPGFVGSTLGLARSLYLQGDLPAAEPLWRSVVADRDIPPGSRIDAAFDLAGVLRGQGHYADSIAAIDDVMPLIREEGLRVSMALSEQGTMQLELGNIEQAAALIDEAVNQAAHAATRYLFARGMLELRLERWDALRDTVQQIHKLTEDADDPDLTKVKAANYLEGLAALMNNDLPTAADLLQAAVDQTGYQYASYKAGLAELHRANEDLAKAAQAALQAAIERDPGDLRLDLELDRARAQLLYAEILAAQGLNAESAQQAQAFLDRWQAGDESPEQLRAASLLATQ